MPRTMFSGVSLRRPRRRWRRRRAAGPASPRPGRAATRRPARTSRSVGPAPETQTGTSAARSRSKSALTGGTRSRRDGLVQPVAQRLGEQPRLRRQGHHGRRGVSRVVDGIAERNRSRQRRAGLTGREPDVDRHERHRSQVGMRVEPDHAVAERQRESAGDRGGGVVGMALDLGREVEHVLGLQPQVEEAVGERDPRDARGRRRTEPAFQRDPVDAVQPDRGQDPAAHAGRVEHRLRHHVGAVGRQLRPLPRPAR